MFSNRSVTSYALNGFLRTFVRPAMLQAARTGDFVNLRKKSIVLGEKFSKMPKEIALVDGQLDTVPVTWLSSKDTNRDKVLLYFHGGGFVLPPLMMHFAFCAQVAISNRLLVALPHYRLAPEHPFPAAPDDCFHAYRWLLDHGNAPENIVIAGDSAGGNLALAVLMMAKQEGLPMPAGVSLMSPALKVGEKIELSDAIDPMFSLETLSCFQSAYFVGDNPNDFRLAPLVGEFAGLPPMQIFVGSAELLKSDSIDAAARAKAAGVTMDLHVVEGMPHIFPLIEGLPEAAEARDGIVAFLASCLAGNKGVVAA